MHNARKLFGEYICEIVGGREPVYLYVTFFDALPNIMVTYVDMFDA
jgi:hypothetical protein